MRKWIPCFVAWGIFCRIGPCLFADDFEAFTASKIHGGQCEIQAARNSNWEDIHEKKVYQTGSTGRTGSESSFVVDFDPKNRFRVLPKTEVVIQTKTRVAGFRKVIDLTMNQGSVKVELENFPPGHQLKVQTPTAVCGAVGTTFKVTSDGNAFNQFDCEKGSIFARAADDNSFIANKIGEDQSLEAHVTPGKENSYTQLRAEGGTIPLSVGLEQNKLDLPEGSIIQTAQDRTTAPEVVAVKVKRGAIHGQGKGSYLMMDGKPETGDPKTSQAIDDYVDLARIEGEQRLNLEKARARGVSQKELDSLQKNLDEAAEKATEKRKELLHYRDEIRRTIREGARNQMIQRPTMVPRGR